MKTMPQQIGAVAIARNEGERLQRCLRSLAGKCGAVVYVDSGSTDGSVDFARSLGVEVVALDGSQPFSMARARNAGFTRLRELLPHLVYVQFVDGDCELEASWLTLAAHWLDMNPDTVVVCGRRQERYPDRSVYNRLCDIEWNTPAGAAKSCGGDALMRARAFADAGGYNAALIAGEEPELCLRLRAAGGRIERIDVPMTLHDAAILNFGMWWRRTLRGGYGAMDVFTRLRGTMRTADIPFHHLTTSAVSWTDRWLLLVGLFTAAALLLAPAGNLPRTVAAVLLGWLLAVGVQAVQALRIARHVRHRAPAFDALRYGLFTMVGKWAQRAGQRRYVRDARAGRTITLIEYKA